MKLSRNAFIKGLNKNTSPELVDSQSYVDAENVILNSLAIDGSLANPKGVSKDTLGPFNWRDTGLNVATDWRCVGMEASSNEDFIYIFLYADTAGSPTGNDYSDRNILIAKSTTGLSDALIMGGYDDVVEWSGDVIDFNVVNYRNEVYLFWLNYDGKPYKINVNEAFNFMDDIQYSSPTIEQKNAIISVMAIPPLFPPVIEYINIPDSESENKIEGVYSFKYRYIYDDGNISAFSPVSKLYYDQVVSGELGQSNSYYYNAITIEYEEVTRTIREVEIAVKKNTDWYVVPVIKSQGFGTHTYTFLDNKSISALGTDSFNTKYFDNVPIYAAAQEFIKNKIAYANYTDNYDSISDLSLATSVSYNKFKDVEIVNDGQPSDFTTYDWGATIGTGVNDNHYIITLADITAVSEVGDTVYISIQEETTYERVGVHVDKHIWKCNTSVKITDLGTILEDIYNAVIGNSTITSSMFSGLAVDYPPGGVTGSLNGSFNGSQVEFFIDSNRATADGTNVPLKHLGNSYYSVTSGNIASTNSFKSGAEHKFGVVYYDKYNRQGDVSISDNSKTYVKWFGERDENSLEYDGSSSILWSINSTPPEWATHYQIVYSGNTTTDTFDTYVCSLLLPETQVDASTTDTTDGSNTARVYLDPLERFREDNRDTLLDYTYQEGDRLFVTGYWDGSNIQTVNVEPISVSIADYKISENARPYIVISMVDYNIINAFLDNVGAPDIGSSPLDWRGFVMEIRNSSSNSINELYYEIGEAYDVGDIGLVTRYHKGETRDQNEDLSANEVNNFGITINTEGVYTSDTLAAIFANWKVGDLFSVQSLGGGDTQDDILCQVRYIEPAGDYITFNSIDGVIDTTYNKDLVPIDSATGIINGGDSFVKTRLYDTPWSGGNDLTVNVIVDSMLPNDFISSFNSGAGRGQVIKRNKNAISRTSSIIISQPLNDDSGFFGATSFPNTAFDYIDLDNSFSQIDKIRNINDNLYVLQDSRVGIQQVEKDILTTAAGNGSVSLTSNVFGNFIPILDGIGTRGYGGYVQTFEGSLFFIDVESRSVYSINGKQLENISTKKIHNDVVIDSFTKSKSSINPVRKEYLITLDSGVYAYNTDIKEWISRWVYNPDQMTYANGSYYSIRNNHLFRHEYTENYNELYDSNGDLVVVPSKVTITGNDPKFNTKSYESVSIVGSNLDTATISGINTNISIAPDVLSLEKHEGVYVSSIGGGYYKDSPVSDSILGIGYSGKTTPTRLEFSDIPHYVSVGDTVYQHTDTADEVVGVISDINYDAMYIDIVATPNVVDGTAFFSITKPSKLDGFDIKGQYLNMTLEFGNSGNAEYVTAIDLEGTNSELIH